jgi:hypothetical protein
MSEEIWNRYERIHTTIAEEESKRPEAVRKETKTLVEKIMSALGMSDSKREAPAPKPTAKSEVDSFALVRASKEYLDAYGKDLAREHPEKRIVL